MDCRVKLGNDRFEDRGRMIRTARNRHLSFSCHEPGTLSCLRDDRRTS
jgi:hypothetical protein